MRWISILVILLNDVALLHAEELRGKAVSVADGVTITVLDSENVQHKIRLQGIDAPEKKQAFGTKSKEALSGKIADQGRSVVEGKRPLRPNPR